MIINLDILKKIQSVNEKCWFNENYIINCEGSNLVIKYDPEEQIFEKEFGVHSLSEFMQLISCFKESEMIFDNNDIVIVDKNSDGVLRYRTTLKSILKEKIVSDARANKMIEGCDDLVKNPDEKWIHFKLTKSLIDKMTKISNVVGSKEKKSKLTFFKNAEDNKILLNVTGGENSYQEKIEILGDSTSNGPVNASIYIDRLIPFDWDCYIFFDRKIKDRGKEIDINDMIIYLKNDEHHLKKLISFII